MKKDVVTLSSQARNRMIDQCQEHKTLRLTVKTRGCSGKAYHLEPGPPYNDGETIVLNDVCILSVDKAAIIYVLGTYIDFQEDDLQSGYVFRNPLQVGQCGCGESFTTQRSESCTHPSHASKSMVD